MEGGWDRGIQEEGSRMKDREFRGMGDEGGEKAGKMEGERAMGENKAGWG